MKCQTIKDNEVPVNCPICEKPFTIRKKISQYELSCCQYELCIYSFEDFDFKYKNILIEQFSTGALKIFISYNPLLIFPKVKFTIKEIYESGVENIVNRCKKMKMFS